MKMLGGEPRYYTHARWGPAGIPKSLSCKMLRSVFSPHSTFCRGNHLQVKHGIALTSCNRRCLRLPLSYPHASHVPLRQPAQNSTTWLFDCTCVDGTRIATRGCGLGTAKLGRRVGGVMFFAASWSVLLLDSSETTTSSLGILP